MNWSSHKNACTAVPHDINCARSADLDTCAQRKAQRKTRSQIYLASLLCTIYLASLLHTIYLASLLHTIYAASLLHAHKQGVTASMVANT